MKIKLEGKVCEIDKSAFKNLDTITIEIEDHHWHNVIWLWSEDKNAYVVVKIEKDGSFITPP